MTYIDGLLGMHPALPLSHEYELDGRQGNPNDWREVMKMKADVMIETMQARREAIAELEEA